MQSIMPAVLIVTWDVRSLIGSFGAGQWMFFCLSFAAVLIMRLTYRHKKRIFKVSLTFVVGIMLLLKVAIIIHVCL